MQFDPKNHVVSPKPQHFAISDKKSSSSVEFIIMVEIINTVNTV